MREYTSKSFFLSEEEVKKINEDVLYFIKYNNYIIFDTYLEKIEELYEKTSSELLYRIITALKEVAVVHVYVPNMYNLKQSKTISINS